MNMENLYRKTDEKSEELIEELKGSESLKPEWITKLIKREEKDTQQTLERLQNASNDADGGQAGEISQSAQ